MSNNGGKRIAEETQNAVEGDDFCKRKQAQAAKEAEAEAKAASARLFAKKENDKKNIQSRL